MSLFEQNITALRQYHTNLANKIRHVVPNPDVYRITPTSTSYPTLIVRGNDDAETEWCDRGDPWQEAQHQLETINRSSIYTPLILGIGLGYTLRIMWDQYRDDFYDLIIVERDPSIFRLALETSKLDGILSYPRTRIVVGEDLSQWPETVRSLMPAVTSSRLETIQHEPSKKLFGKFYQSVVNTVQEQTKLTLAEFDLMLRSGGTIQENLWLNIPAMITSFGTQDVKNLWHGLPAVVAAAGPSLDKNVHLLREVHDQCVVICVDTAYRTLVSNGIHPHIVVSTDPTPLNVKHFEGIEPSQHTILAFDPEVNYKIPSQWPYHKILLNLDKSLITRWIESLCGPFGYVQKGGSVGHTAFYLARDLGCDPIVLVGLDLAYDSKGGKTHSSGAALARRYDTISHGIESTRMSEMPVGHSQPMQEYIVWVPGTTEKLVPTSKVMALYIHQFNIEITKCSAQVIDATEGGAKLEGSEIRALREVLDQYINNSPRPISKIHDVALPKRNVSGLVRQTQIVVDNLRQANRIAQLGITRCNALKKRVHEGASLRQAVEWSEMEQCFNQLYQPNELKIALDQVMFEGTYHFVKKERVHEVDTRIGKYRHYFELFLQAQPVFLERIEYALTQLKKLAQ